MQSTSNTTCSARTSPTDRATVMTGSGHSGGRFRPTNRIGGSYTGPGFPVTVSPRPAGAPQPGDHRHASSGWGEAPLAVDRDLDSPVCLMLLIGDGIRKARVA